MLNTFQWDAPSADMPDLPFLLLERWLVEVARAHGCLVGDINYLFCDDEEILRTNRQFLGHDYYTDIITFDRRRGRLLRGDIVISLDTVASNAQALAVDPRRELLRVIAHGLLHLCGINDKGPGERQIMEQHEEQALGLLDTMEKEA